MPTRNKQRPSDQPAQQKSLRLWPGIVIALLLLFIRFGLIIIMPEALLYAVYGEFIAVLAIIVWWVFFSRAARFERWGAVVLLIAALVATQLVSHKSMQMMPFVAYIIPVVSLAFVLWAVVTKHLSNRIRRLTMVATIVIVCAAWALVRTSGVSGEFHSNFLWRWSDTPEERLLAKTSNEQIVSPPVDSIVIKSEADWPGFRGANRDGLIRGVRIDTDWSDSPPVELWRRPIGPGWSSFAVSGDLFFTQEQRGEDEVVACYNMTTGKPLWMHSDATRFWESNAGAGPRGTPTLSEGRVYALGATGILNVLNAADGSVVWSRNVGTDTDTKVPMWGFSSSPLVIDDLVIIAAAGSLIAYEITTGDPRWSIPAGGDCYSSPHLATIDGITQILLMNDAGTVSVIPADGTVLWEHTWSGHPIVQPTLIADGDIIVSADELTGVRRISIAHNSAGWTVKEHWTSTRLKPYFNDSVIHNGYAYGFDGRSIACIDITDGERKWKGGRYGRGQLLLLADQDLLLVISEKGDLALVEAVPGQFTELARVPAIKGKTWNHPVLVDDILLVRNAQEMAAFRLSLVES